MVPSTDIDYYTEIGIYLGRSGRALSPALTCPVVAYPRKSWLAPVSRYIRIAHLGIRYLREKVSSGPKTLGEGSSTRPAPHLQESGQSGHPGHTSPRCVLRGRLCWPDSCHTES